MLQDHSQMSEQLLTDRTRVRRIPDRGAYDPKTVYRILDEGLVCHVGFVIDAQPYVIPTAYARRGDRICLHGSAGSRMLRAIGKGGQLCITVTLIDGLVLARSAFDHSMNYRSVVILGKGTVVDNPDEKLRTLRAISDHLIPGRWNDVRPPNEQELCQTRVIAVPITEASAKIRTGPPKDDEADYDLPIWAGVIPLRMIALPPVVDPMLRFDLSPPNYAIEYPGPAAVD